MWEKRKTRKDLLASSYGTLIYRVVHNERRKINTGNLQVYLNGVRNVRLMLPGEMCTLVQWVLQLIYIMNHPVIKSCTGQSRFFLACQERLSGSAINFPLSFTRDHIYFLSKESFFFFQKMHAGKIAEPQTIKNIAVV